jgi:hypothetical protein
LGYKHDAGFLLSLACEIMVDLTLYTQKWRSIYYEQPYLTMELNRKSWVNFQPIYELAEIFVHSKQGAPRKILSNLAELLGEISYNHECGCLDEARQDLPSVLISLDPAIGSRIARLHSRILEQQQSQLKPQLSHETETTQQQGETFQPLKRKRVENGIMPTEVH